jgi:hypothetical protein
MDVKMQIRPIGAKEAIAGLRKIFGELQDFDRGFHDQWNWMDAEFYVDVLEHLLSRPDNGQPRGDSDDLTIWPAWVKETK